MFNNKKISKRAGYLTNFLFNSNFFSFHDITNDTSIITIIISSVIKTLFNIFCYNCYFISFTSLGLSMYFSWSSSVFIITIVIIINTIYIFIFFIVIIIIIGYFLLLFPIFTVVIVIKLSLPLLSPSIALLIF